MPFPGPLARAPTTVPGSQRSPRHERAGERGAGKHGPQGQPPQAPRHAHGSRAGLDPTLHVSGTHSVEAVLRHQPGRAQRLHVARVENPLVELAKGLGVSVNVVEPDALDGMAGRGAVHQGVVLECSEHPYVDIEDYAEAPELTLILDGVEDPRNLGAAARAAYAMGATLVVVPRDRAAAVTASAHRTSAGALSRIDVAQVNNLKRALDMLREKGAWIVGAEADGKEDPWSVDLKGKIALVVGGEDTGLRRLTRETCDHVVAIPMAAPGVSLNAADAATVLLYEVLRQRRAPVSEG